MVGASPLIGETSLAAVVEDHWKTVRSKLPGPGRIAEGFADEQFPSRSVEYIKETVAIGDHHDFARLAIDRELAQDRHMPRESPPQPDSTATYCLPSIVNDVGGATIPELVGNSHSSFPVAASNA